MVRLQAARCLNPSVWPPARTGHNWTGTVRLWLTVSSLLKPTLLMMHSELNNKSVLLYSCSNTYKKVLLQNTVFKALRHYTPQLAWQRYCSVFSSWVSPSEGTCGSNMESRNHFISLCCCILTRFMSLQIHDNPICIQTVAKPSWCVQWCGTYTVWACLRWWGLEDVATVLSLQTSTTWRCSDWFKLGLINPNSYSMKVNKTLSSTQMVLWRTWL